MDENVESVELNVALGLTVLERIERAFPVLANHDYLPSISVSGDRFSQARAICENLAVKIVASLDQRSAAPFGRNRERNCGSVRTMQGEYYGFNIYTHAQPIMSKLLGPIEAWSGLGSIVYVPFAISQRFSGEWLYAAELEES